MSIRRRFGGLGLGMGLGGGGVDLCGPELVINGGFDADTNWLKTGGWVTGGISGGTANCNFNGANNFMTNDGVVEAGKTYKYSVDIVAITGGLFRVRLGTAISSNLTSVGTHTGTIVSNGTPIIAFGDPDAVGEIDNFSIKEVL